MPSTKLKRWPFRRARAFARSLGLKTFWAWINYARNGRPGLPPRPEGVPIMPATVYKGKGWIGYSDWIGADTSRSCAPGKPPRKFRKYVTDWVSYEEASALAARCNIRSAEEWKKFTAGKVKRAEKCPRNVPTNPQIVYRHCGWKSWGEFLQTGYVCSRDLHAALLGFGLARAIARSLGLSSSGEWRRLILSGRRIRGISTKHFPLNPDSSYAKDGWKGWNDYLGEESNCATNGAAQGREIKPLNALKGAEAILQRQVPAPGLLAYSSQSRHLQRGTKPSTETTAERWSFRRARAFARSLRLGKFADWIAYARGQRPDLPPRPAGIPVAPWIAYMGKGWIGYSDWIGANTARSCRQGKAPRKCRKIHRGAWMPYELASALAAICHISNAEEWKKYAAGKLKRAVKCPPNAPTNPQLVYKNRGWISWGEFLQTGTVSMAERHQAMISFGRARAIARSLGLSSSIEWQTLLRKRTRIAGVAVERLPLNPDGCYANDGWKGWGDFLDCEFVSYRDAQRIVRKCRIKTLRGLRSAKAGRLARVLKFVPVDPPSAYLGQWQNSYQFFGTDPRGKFQAARLREAA